MRLSHEASRRLAVVVALAVPLSTACGQEEISATPDGRITRDRVALLAVVENNDSIDPTTTALFNANRDLAQPFVARTLGVASEALTGLTLTQIGDRYMEDWLIRQLELNATYRYDRFASLTDGEATSSRFVDAIDGLQREGFLVDVILVLHGGNDSVWFADGVLGIHTLTAEVARRQVGIRALYQTCCFGGSTIDDWQGIRVSAVNGAKGLNGLCMLSPIYFVQRWAGGLPFDQAVQAATQDEIAALRAYETQLGMGPVLLDAQTIEQSQQLVGGVKRDLLWSDRWSFLPPE